MCPVYQPRFGLGLIPVLLQPNEYLNILVLHQQPQMTYVVEILAYILSLHHRPTELPGFTTKKVQPIWRGVAVSGPPGDSWAAGPPYIRPAAVEIGAHATLRARARTPS